MIPGPNLLGQQVLQSGTSQSAAVVTGIAAMLASNATHYSASDIKCAILSNHQSSEALVDLIVSEGVVNANEALENLSTSDCQFGFTRSISEEDYFVEVFPNPFDDFININFSTEIDEIKLYDVNGNMILGKKAISSFEYNLEAGNLIPGIYVLEIKSRDLLVHHKLIKP